MLRKFYKIIYKLPHAFLLGAIVFLFLAFVAGIVYSITLLIP